jgi:A/G-specific adenine glycosylase
MENKQPNEQRVSTQQVDAQLELSVAPVNDDVMNDSEFAERVLNWFDQHGRKNLPWQKDITPYRVWVSEIMLQQTQVATVIPYFQTFMHRFPDVISLANAEQDEVLKYWSGLGYYSRARNLHKAAQMVRDEFDGVFPQTMELVQQLPGIGRSTAAAILSIACHQKEAILDGNVKRVLARYHAIDGWPGKSSVLKRFWEYAEAALPDDVLLASPARIADYTQAMMDLGATLCKRSKPSCIDCPLQTGCKAFLQGNVAEYPTPKPKKRLPEKACIMLILQNHRQALLLEKRPSTGIWGGLWAFPQFEDEAALQDWLISREYQFEDMEIIELPTIKHTFSHFHLHIAPHLYRISEKSASVKRIMEADSLLWYNVNQEFPGGLPQPVSRILNMLRNQQ